ncbi:MAG: hypothetical protein JSU70_20210 [Phycisphaerales bacterium]|nr:MAG: hypothetical protein JSU70_20210 [Phycisphaerales bacterium]
MKKNILISLLLVTGLFLFVNSCGQMMTDMTDAERLYRAKCSSCHAIIEPNRHDEETWRLYVDRYGKKMTDEQKQTVLQHLTGLE